MVRKSSGNWSRKIMQEKYCKVALCEFLPSVRETALRKCHCTGVIFYRMLFLTYRSCARIILCIVLSGTLLHAEEYTLLVASQVASNSSAFFRRVPSCVTSSLALPWGVTRSTLSNEHDYTPWGVLGYKIGLLRYQSSKLLFKVNISICPNSTTSQAISSKSL